MTVKSLLVTGAAGFIGARLVRWLIEKEKVPPSQLTLVDHHDYFKTRICTKGFRDLPTTFIDSGDLLSQIDSKHFTHIFHIGACSSTTETNKEYLTENNVNYSKALWNYACQNKTPFYFASSAATYGAGEYGYSDDELLIPKLRPLNLYGWSKQAFDLFVLEQKQQAHTPPHWIGYKYFNVYGPGEEHKGPQSSVLWQAMNQLRERGFVRLFKSHKEGIRDGEQKRDFVYVDDVMKVMLYFYKNTHTPSGIYNLGSGRARSFNDLVTAVAAAMQRPCKIEYVDTPTQIREHYQYWTEAPMNKTRQAGYTDTFTSLEEGAELYVKEVGFL